MSLDLRDVLEKGGLVIAHRGARSIAPENSLAAGAKGLAACARMWEIDVRLTRDRELVVTHDATLDRVSDVQSRFPLRSPWYVHDFTLKELKTLDCGRWFNVSDPFGQIAAGAVSGEEMAGYEGQRLPSLEEAILFTVANDWLVNIEIKDLEGFPGHDRIVEKVVGLVRSLHATERVLLSSFNLEYLARIRKLDRDIATGVLLKRYHPDPLHLLLELNASTFNPARPAFRPWQVARLKKRGLGTLVWVVNRKTLGYALVKMGVNGIFTDFPQRFASKHGFRPT